jgi:catechol 2,3-dioxygenase-like lactoylglutathione lyase family enzyme
MSISGLYENCVAAHSIDGAARYWQEFGYRPVQHGSLTADEAEQLYGHRSAVESLRMQNGDSRDHGLLRIFVWDQPRNSGLGTAPPMTVGGRWFIQNCRDIWLIHDTFQDAKAAGMPFVVSTPSRAQIGEVHKGTDGIFDRNTAVRELMVLGPGIRQAFFQRYNYNRPLYGVIPPTSPLGTSEATHSSFIVSDDSHGQFYVDVLGMRVTNELHESHGGKPGNADTLMIQPDQRFTIMGFKAPGKDVGMFQFYKPLFETEDLFDRSRPGSMGLSLSTFRVSNVDEYHARVSASAATGVTPITRNEFGERSFSFVAPDRVFWTLVGA